MVFSLQNESSAFLFVHFWSFLLFYWSKKSRHSMAEEVILIIELFPF